MQKVLLMRRSLVLSLMIGLLALSGCTRTKMREGFTEMVGTVTMDGKPLAEAEVEIEGANGRSYGKTDANGHYEAWYSQTLKGAPIGSALVRIRTGVVFRDSRPGTYKFNSAGDPYRGETVPARYNKKSELEISIVDDGSPYDFELSSNGT